MFGFFKRRRKAPAFSPTPGRPRPYLGRYPIRTHRSMAEVMADESRDSRPEPPAEASTAPFPPVDADIFHDPARNLTGAASSLVPSFHEADNA